VACVPSLYEGFSLPTAELMACETPLVVSRAGAIPEVVGPDGECADLVTPGDVRSMAEYVDHLMSDSEHRVKMGGLAVDEVAHYSDDRVGRQWLTLVSDLRSWRGAPVR